MIVVTVSRGIFQRKLALGCMIVVNALKGIQNVPVFIVEVVVWVNLEKVKVISVYVKRGIMMMNLYY